MTRPYFPTQIDGRAARLNNELSVLLAVRHFGHLRRQELAMAVWPKTSPSSAYIMACRTVKHMLKQELLLERPNFLGTTSVILSSKGVGRLRDHDVKATEGYDLSFNGPQFFHRTIGTCYLLEKARKGDKVFGEYSILRGWSPLDREETRLKFSKAPDGLIVFDGAALGLRAGVRAADWVEIESAFKSYTNIKKALTILTKDPSLDKPGTLILNKLVFVFDTRQKHERQILRYLKKFIRETPGLSEEAFLQEIIFARCYLDAPFTWHGVQEITAWELLNDQSLILEDLDSVSEEAEAEGELMSE